MARQYVRRYIVEDGSVHEMKWEVASALNTEVPEMLEQGWEPFAVTSFQGCSYLMLRRQYYDE